jgi:MFS family permease
MFTVSATALLFRVVDNTNRGRATGLFQSGFLIGGLLGPLVGGVLTDYSLRPPFYVYAVSLIAAGSIAAVFLQSAKLRDEAMTTRVRADGVLVEEPQTTSLSQAWAHPSYRAAVAVNFAIGFALFGVRMSLVPLFVTEGMGQRPVWIGVGFLCSSIAQVGFLVFAGRYVDRSGRKPAMVAGSLITAVSLGLITFSTQLSVFLVSMVAMGVGGAFVGTAPGAVVGDVMQGRGGRVVAVFQMASDLGAITGPLIAGLLADSVTFGTGFGACAIVLLFAAWMSARMPETLIRE